MVTVGETCFVTGAGGFVGAALCRRLLAQGYSVRGLDLHFGPAAGVYSADLRSASVRRDRSPLGRFEVPSATGPAAGVDSAAQPERLLMGDVNDVDLLAEGCRGARYVFHLAAVLPQRRLPPAAMRRVNVEGAQRLLEAARAAGVRRFVLMSSCEVYGVPAMIPCPEDAPLRPNGEYGRNKVAAERLALAAAQHGLEVVILRSPTIVGPGMPEKLLRGTLAALRRGRPVLVPTGSTRFQMIAVSDVVEACLLAATRPEAAGQIFNIGSDHVPTLLQATRMVRDRLGSRSHVVPVPRALARAGFRLLSALGRSPLEPEHVEIAFSDYVFDTQKATRLLGWRPAVDHVQALVEAAAAL